MEQIQNPRNDKTLIPQIQTQTQTQTQTQSPTSTSPSPFSPSSRRHPQFHPSPQWAHHETVALITIRGQLEMEFNSSKRNKPLWETVALKLNELGFHRTPDQCKCKWKNLVVRYKGKETSDHDNGKQCPFFEELHAVFSERANAMQSSLMESQSVAVRSRKRTKGNSDQFSDEYSQDEGDQGDDSGDESLLRSSSNFPKKKAKEYVGKCAEPSSGNVHDVSSSNSVGEILKLFFKQQQRIEMQWRESMERHRHERELFKQDWRQSMEKLERERLVMEREWMEKEEQRKMREEIRAEKRDALLTMLLNKLLSEDQS